MATVIITPNMQLPNPVPGVDPGIDYANNLQSSLNIVDGHNHSVGSGVQIQPNGLNINSDLSFQSNNAVNLRATRFTPQLSPISNSGSDIGELYVSGNELYYNDVTGGNQIQITTNGTVNATSSGISSGTNSAAFVSNILVVKASSTNGADVKMQSALLTNSGNLTNILTLAAPTLSSSFQLTLPIIPGASSFMQMDNAGNMSASIAIANGITRANLAAVGQQVSSTCGNFSTSSTTPVDVTNLNITITTTGRPVMLMIQGDGSSGNFGVLGCSSATNAGVTTLVCNGIISIVRGSTTIYNNTFQELAIATTATIKQISLQLPLGIPYLDTPTAGTYTYKVQLKDAGTGTTSSASFINFAILMAYEL